MLFTMYFANCARRFGCAMQVAFKSSIFDGDTSCGDDSDGDFDLAFLRIVALSVDRSSHGRSFQTLVLVRFPWDGVLA